MWHSGCLYACNLTSFENKFTNGRFRVVAVDLCLEKYISTGRLWVSGGFFFERVAVDFLSFPAVQVVDIFRFVFRRVCEDLFLCEMRIFCLFMPRNWLSYA